MCLELEQMFKFLHDPQLLDLKNKTIVQKIYFKIFLIQLFKYFDFVSCQTVPKIATVVVVFPFLDLMVHAPSIYYLSSYPC